MTADVKILIIIIQQLTDFDTRRSQLSRAIEGVKVFEFGVIVGPVVVLVMVVVLVKVVSVVVMVW